MPVRMDAREQGTRCPYTVFVQLILGQAKPKNRWRQADHGERILGHTSSSCTGFASPAARVSPYRFIKSAHASSVSTVSTTMSSSIATSRRLTASSAHRPVIWCVIHATCEGGVQCTGCEFAGMPTLLALARVDAMNDSQARCLQHHGWARRGGA